MQQNTAVIVLGMHRSGTSALAGMLDILGVQFGKSLLAPSADNPKGFWEHLEILDIHERLLAFLGSSWDDPRPLPASWWLSDPVQPFHADIVRVLRRDFERVPVWGLNNDFLDEYVSAFEHIGAGATVLTIPMGKEFNGEPITGFAGIDVFNQSQHYLLWEKPAGILVNQQAHVNYFPIVFRSEVDPFNRHFPANLQIHGNRIYIAPPRELHSLRSPPMTRLWRADHVRKAIWQRFPPSRHTSPVFSTLPSISSAYAGTGLRRRSSIKAKIFWNKIFDTATSASWNVT